MITRIRQFIIAATGRGQLTQPPENRLERVLLYAVVLGRQGTLQLVAHKAPQMAAALAYRTIFSLIPLLALTFVVLQAFYKEDGVETLLVKMFEWAGISEIQIEGERLADHLETYVTNAANAVSGINFGLITVVGLGLLIYAALSLVIQIETSFNTICRAPRGRKLVTRLTTYWKVITLGSLGLVLSFSLGQAYERTLSDLPSWAASVSYPLRLFTRIGVTWLVLLFVYFQLPNTRVQLKAAAIGAAVGAVFWELGKTAMTSFIMAMTSGKTEIYGPLALVPLFLLWVYCTWLIVLFGLEVTAAIQSVTRETLARLGRERDYSVPLDPADAIVVTTLLAQAFNANETLDLGDLSEKTDLSASTIDQIVECMIEAGIINRVLRGEEESLTIARPTSDIALRDVLDAAYALKLDDSPHPLMKRMRTMAIEDAGNRTIADLLTDDEA